jgi:uncharacterized surface protein with fasciclin (FAS1) repeats
LIGNISQDELGNELFGFLAGTRRIFFAPVNSGLDNEPSLWANITRATEVMAYHFVGVDVLPPFNGQHQLLDTYYTDPQLPNNQSQPLVLSQELDGSQTLILGAAEATRVTGGPYSEGNLTLYSIDKVVGLPEPITMTAREATQSFSIFMRFLQDNSLAISLENSQGVTVFAPVDTVPWYTTPSFTALNTSSRQAALNKHITPQVLYSNQFSDGNMNTTSNKGLVFTSNSSGTFVTVDSNTARIVRSDIIITNGVVHAIDSALFGQETASGEGTGGGGLSTGAIVGIAVGAAVLVFGLALVAFLIYRRSRHKRQTLAKDNRNLLNGDVPGQLIPVDSPMSETVQVPSWSHVTPLASPSQESRNSAFEVDNSTSRSLVSAIAGASCVQPSDEVHPTDRMNGRVSPTVVNNDRGGNRSPRPLPRPPTSFSYEQEEDAGHLAAGATLPPGYRNK